MIDPEVEKSRDHLPPKGASAAPDIFPAHPALSDWSVQSRAPPGALLEAGRALLTGREPDMQRQTRLKRELQLLSTEPPSGVSCWQVGDRIDELRAQVVGAAGSPYEGGVFALEIAVPERYPFEPPRVHFATPIYHPNIDSAGRICLDILKPPPKGAWRPALSLSSVLTSIQLLMSEPNPEDPLMADIAREYKYHRAAYVATARSWTQKHAGATHKRAGREREEPAKRPCVGEEEERDVTGRAE